MCSMKMHQDFVDIFQIIQIEKEDFSEKAKLLSEGWNYEGVAFNSASTDDVQQYRLHNPNASCGAYHFTGSTEERDLLISFGWEYQGIGFYSCVR